MDRAREKEGPMAIYEETSVVIRNTIPFLQGLLTQLADKQMTELELYRSTLMILLLYKQQYTRTLLSMLLLFDIIRCIGLDLQSHCVYLMIVK